MQFKDGVGVRTVTASVTGTSVQTVVPIASGYVCNIAQITMHEEQGGIRDIRMYFGNTFLINMTIGASGTIVWDYQLTQPVPIGSGFNASLNVPGNVTMMVRYVLTDERTPTTFNTANYRPFTTRKPNNFGRQ